MIRLNKNMTRLERKFISVLREDYGFTERKDKKGKTVRIAPGYSYRENPMDGLKWSPWRSQGQTDFSYGSWEAGERGCLCC